MRTRSALPATKSTCLTLVIIDRNSLLLLRQEMKIKVIRLLQGLQIRHQIMDVGIGVLAELLRVSSHGGVDFEMHVSSAPGSISIARIGERDREFVEVCQSAGDGFSGNKRYCDF